jgi:5-formyltetrahydrofolate cyclo-ligase
MAHELEPGRDPALDVDLWRRAERKRHLDARMALPLSDRVARDRQIAATLTQTIGNAEGLTVSAYWPIRCEPDLRPLLAELTAAGAICALPVVVERGRPLEFRAWSYGERLERGIWNIPVPAAGTRVEPDVLLAPVVAFDRDCYRLGYGGGYFDRSLAALRKAYRVIGVGYSMAGIRTIYPQPHDVRMHAIVTELGLLSPPACP